MKTVYADVETGGIEPQYPTIQLAAVAIDDETGAELDSFQAKIQFDESRAQPEALKLNHYDAAVWRRESVPVAEAVRRFARWSQPFRCIDMLSKRTGSSYSVAKLSGYNALRFDEPRIREMFGAEFFPFSYHVRDVLQRVLFWFDENPQAKKPENVKLATMCRYFGIPVRDAHDALVDVRLTAALAWKLRHPAEQRQLEVA